MSGSLGTDLVEGGIGFTELSLSRLGSPLTNLLLTDDIIPGSPLGYQTAKIIYTYHPLGAKMAETPINMAQSQDREITVPGGPESRLIPAFEREWRTIGVVGADSLIRNTMTLARVYGIASIVVGNRGGSQASPLPVDKIHEVDLYFNVLDPLNTAGSLTLNQDPNAEDFQKPRIIQAAGKDWHSSRAVVMMNEQPVYIEWTNSAFGFVGRSVYQRALFPLKSYVQSMVTDDMVTKKIGLLIWKSKSPSSGMNSRIAAFFGWKRNQLQSGVSGNVMTVGHEDDVASLNFQNLEGAGRFTRDNILKNIATAAGMPARMLDQETLVSGFGEGVEDAKQIARYIDRMRFEMQPLYTFFDNIVQRRAWSPDFYETLKEDYPEYRKVPYETAFYQWRNAFTAIWPNLLVEPDSERVKVEETRFKSVVALLETMSPLLDPENKAALVAWAADQINDRKELFSATLLIDQEALAEYTPPTEMAGGEGEGKEPTAPPFSGRT